MKRTAILLLLGTALFVLGSWGFLVHRTVHQLAVYKLPKGMQHFFYSNMEYLVSNAPRPDIRTGTDPAEGPKHYIDFELLGDSAIWKAPLTRAEAFRQYGADSLAHTGYLPYQIETTLELLTNAFRNKNRDSILFYAADLGHYIGDAHVPLHTTENYDGQLSNQKGLHSLWETLVPVLFLDSFHLYSRHKAKYLRQPAEKLRVALRQANSLLPAVFNEEIQASKNFTDSLKYRVQIRNGKESRSYSTAFAQEYGNRCGKAINQQLLRSADLIADYWYTAWVNAGRPNLAALENKPFDKDSYKKEQQVYKKNELIKNKMLLSKKEQQ
ncbi:MAG: hypothetical protein KF862_18155 [Chitinophagaceae bacterium]|nr:hypothetical protein [Chitinophagaceae bacterium]